MAGETEGRAIFISYRRDDTEGEAGRLYDDLVRAYSDDSVFMDVSDIQPGLDFRKAIDQNVACCGVLLAVIGPTWATVTDSGGNRRLDNSSDFVRLEIASALARSIAVIPVLVHGARMPALDQLPDDLKDLRYRNSVELTHARWNSDVALLVAALKSYVRVNKSQETETVHATIPVQLPAPQAAQPAPAPKRSRVPLVAAIAAVVILAAAAAGYFVMKGNDSSSAPQIKPAVADSHTTVPTPTPSPETHPSPPSAVQTPVGPGVALLGKWKNSKEVTATDALTDLTVASFGGQIMVHAWGKSERGVYDWGTRTATMQGSAVVTDLWQLRNTDTEKQNQRTVSLSLTADGDGLQVTVHNTYIQPNGQTREIFTPLQFEKKP